MEQVHKKCLLEIILPEVEYKSSGSRFSTYLPYLGKNI